MNYRQLGVLSLLLASMACAPSESIEEAREPQGSVEAVGNRASQEATAVIRDDQDGSGVIERPVAPTHVPKTRAPNADEDGFNAQSQTVRTK